MKMIRRLLALTLLILAPAAGMSAGQNPAPAQPEVKPVYEVYAISYGVLPDFPVSQLVAGADKSRKMDIQMMFWLLKGPGGRNILVDCGFHREKFFKDWKVKDYIKPSDALKKLGLKPSDITDVIITHMHWDHADGLDLFPTAKVWIQKDEYDYYINDPDTPGKNRSGVDPEDVAVVAATKNHHKQLKIVDGDNKELIRGVVFYTGGRHTYASQYVGVNTKAGTVVVASDNLYLYENLDKHAPIAATFDAASNLKAQERMKQIASNPRFIVPGHDPDVFVRFPKPGNGIAKIE
ncbi:MAG: hydrolase glyoxylase [Blastocatellia bacterium AA13]|nr:MAG: hydrolase glyoxylase [Blastocatellia bacterium AA13]